MNRILKTVATLAAVTLISAGCSDKNQVADTSPATKAPSASRNWPPPDDATPTADLVVETPTPAPSLSTAKFGVSGNFTQDNANSFVVTVAAPGKAKCQYSSIGCDKAQTGDRVVTTKVTVKPRSTDEQGAVS